MRIRVNNVGEETTKKSAKGFYKVFTLAYESDGRPRTRDIPNFDKATYATLKSALPGDEFDITLVKNGEYTNWSGAEKAAKTEVSATKTGFTKASTYETSEERAQRQLYIIRQSSIGHAVELLAGKKDGTVDNVLEVADRFVQYVLHGNEADFDISTNSDTPASDSIE